MKRKAINNLTASWEHCKKASHWLQRSFHNSPEPPYANLSEEQWDQLEALASRYARFTDLIINRLLRSLDYFEFIEPGSIIDTQIVP